MMVRNAKLEFKALQLWLYTSWMVANRFISINSVADYKHLIIWCTFWVATHKAIKMNAWMYEEWQISMSMTDFWIKSDKNANEIRDKKSFQSWNNGSKNYDAALMLLIIWIDDEVGMGVNVKSSVSA